MERHGPDAGNKVVTVVGNSRKGFASGSSFSCKFGKGMPSQVRRISASSVECVSPARGSSGNVSISLSDNWADYKQGGAMYKYEATLQTMSVVQGSGFVEGSTEVTVVVVGFEEDMQLQCRFWQKEVPTRFMSSMLLSCISPAHPGGFSSLGMSDQGSGAMSKRSLGFEFRDGSQVEQVFPSTGGTEREIAPSFGFGASASGAARARARARAKESERGRVWCATLRFI